ncbi:RTA-like protein [Mycena pura]|uniref:RTA-like protein n=1 Tax=Mycena pura TaxID=153505 RepID=A0AAD6UYC6_9AGAR|nr:RTA-like protein [Mycena pura]
MDNEEASQAIGGFVPRDDLSIIALCMFSFSAAIHWILMSLGFGIRILYARNLTSLGLYVVMNMCIVLSPCAFLATDYMLLVRLAATLDHKVRARVLPLHPARIVAIFVGSDITTFILQGLGGGMTTIGPATVGIGEKISLVGLSVQLASFAIFTVLLLNFGWRLRAEYPAIWAQHARHPATTRFWAIFSAQHENEWRTLYFTMCLTCIGILIRSVFRIVEFSGGYTGFVATHEGYFYALDALPLWLATALYAIVWPARFLPHERSATISMSISTGEGKRVSRCGETLARD